jgi:formyl-CoA transferase
MGVLLDSHWKLLAELIGRPELADDPGQARRETVDGLVSDWLAERSVAEAEKLLVDAGLPCAAVQSYADAAANPHVRDREMLQETDVEGARVPLTGPAAKFSRTPTRIRSGPPALGADTDTILEDLGVDEEERTQLRQQGVI